MEQQKLYNIKTETPKQFYCTPFRGFFIRRYKNDISHQQFMGNTSADAMAGRAARYARLRRREDLGRGHHAIMPRAITQPGACCCTRAWTTCSRRCSDVSPTTSGPLSGCRPRLLAPPTFSPASSCLSGSPSSSIKVPAKGEWRARLRRKTELCPISFVWR